MAETKHHKISHKLWQPFYCDVTNAMMAAMLNVEVLKALHAHVPP
jgi:hypothetical protein